MHGTGYHRARGSYQHSVPSLVLPNVHSHQFKIWISIKILLKYVSNGPNHDIPAFGSDSGLVPNERQAIIWTSGRLDYWRLYEHICATGPRWGKCLRQRQVAVLIQDLGFIRYIKYMFWPSLKNAHQISFPEYNGSFLKQEPNVEIFQDNHNITTTYEICFCY